MSRVIAAALLTASAARSASAICPGKTGDYDGYNILSVEINNPIGFITPWASLSNSLRKGLRLEAGKPFSAADFLSDSAWLGTTLRAEFASGAHKIRFSYAGGEIRDCNPQDRTLLVMYPIFTSVLPLVLPTIEEQANESQRPGTTGAVRSADVDTDAIPLGGYDPTRGILGGMKFSETWRKLDTKGEFEGSSNSRSGHLDLGSHIGPVPGLWDRADWAATFEYEETPANAARFGEGKITGRFSAATKESAAGHVIFRYGAALEGGHQQTAGINAPALLPHDSAFGSMKLYAGITGRRSDSAFTASGGLQLGTTLTSGVPVFRKYLLDLGYNHTFPVARPKPLGDRENFTHVGLTGRVHRSLGLETRFTAGLIQAVAGAPLAERFLGGNELRPFVQDGTWVIPGDAFIRSIPENRLGAEAGTVMGGSRFYSANATVSFTAWGKPILPKELVAVSSTDASSGFPEILNAPFNTAATAIANTKKLADPQYLSLVAGVSAQAADLKQKLAALSDKLKEVPANLAAQPAMKRNLTDIRRNILSAKAGAGEVVSKPDPQIVATLATNTIPALSGLLEQLTEDLSQNSQASLALQLNNMRTDIVALTGKISAADNIPVQKYLDEAWRDLAPGHRALDVFLHDLNIFAVSPVAMFDAARVWPVGERAHYGIGPGLRLSIVNANFTVGYSVNPVRVRGEKPGAIFVKLDVTTLF